MINYFLLLFTSSLLVLGCNKENIIEPPVKVEDFWRPTNCPQTTVHEIKECSNGFLFAITSNGVLKSTDNGDNWDYCLTKNNLEWAIAISKNDRIAIVDYGRLLISSDYGNTWENKQLKTDSVGIFLISNDICFDEEERIFIATDQGVIRSEDLGTSWVLLTQGMFIKNIRTVYVTNDNDKIVAGANSSLNALYHSSNRGDTWIENQTIVHQIIFCLAEDSVGNLFAAGNGALFYSVDKGVSWIVIATANDIFSNVIIVNENIYVAFAAGSVFYSDDGSINYKDLNSGFDKSKGTCLHYSKTSFLFSGTVYDGIYKSKKTLK